MIATDMTLRDFFAAMAMAGDWSADKDSSCVSSSGVDHAARRYYDMADAMIAERERRMVAEAEK